MESEVRFPHHPTQSPVVVVLSVLEAGDVSSPQQQLLILDNEQRSTDAASVREDADLSVSYVTHHRYLDDACIPTHII